VNDVKSVTSHLDPLQAAVLAFKLGHLDDWNARRKAIAERYVSALADTPLILPSVPDWPTRLGIFTSSAAWIARDS
jgi:dTDP-4-amino-4,6-dideoxygalactose transaminase